MMAELCLHIIDVVQNSTAADAENVKIQLKDSQKEDLILIAVTDDGCGMDQQTLENVQNPFYTTKSGKKVGLGIPLLKAGSFDCDGSFHMQSTPGQGTNVSSTFKRSHIDTPPVGDVNDTIFTLIVGTDQCNIEFDYTTDKGAFCISIAEVKDQVGDVPLTHPEIIGFLREYISTNVQQLTT